MSARIFRPSTWFGGKSGSGARKDQMPLAELHCHIEGTIAPDMARRLGARHKVDISHIFRPDGNYQWSTFPDFLKVYDVVSSVVRSVDDYYDITTDYLTRAAAEGLIYSEMFISSEHPEDVGLSYDAFTQGVVSALEDVEARTGLVGRFILTSIRHRGPERAERTAGFASKYPNDRIVGFGLAGDESQFEPKDFVRAYDIATEAGLRRTAHAGEVEGADSVRATLDALKPERIGHGVRLLEDPDLAERIRDEGVTLELSPGSNIAIGLFKSYGDHPVKVLVDKGLKVTLSTDDPPFFSTTIGKEYAEVEAAHGFSKSGMMQFTLNSIDAAFCDEKTKAQLRSKAERWAQKNLQKA
jgi:adenosine deaminase